MVRLVRFLPFSVSLGGDGFPPFIIDRRNGGFRIIKLGLIPLFDWQWWEFSLRHQSLLATVLRLGHVPDEHIEASNTCGQHELPSCDREEEDVMEDDEEDWVEFLPAIDSGDNTMLPQAPRIAQSSQSGSRRQCHSPYDLPHDSSSQTPTNEL
jgi:hypothetical protein